MATQLAQLESAAEAKYGLPEGMLGSIRQQETGGNQAYLDDPTKPHYPTGYTKTGTKSSAFGPYGIVESTARDPGYGTKPLAGKTLAEQVDFAASYLTGRAKSAGSLEAGLAGYGEGSKYAKQVLGRLGATTMDITTAPTQSPSLPPSNIDSLATANIARNDATAAALEGFNKDMQGQFGALTTLVGEQASAAETVKTTELMATAQAQANTAKAAIEIGTDPNAASYALNKIAQQYAVNSERAQKFADRVANVADPANLLNDPLTYIRDLVFYDFNVAAQRSAESAAQNTKDRFIGLNNMTQEVAQTQTLINQGVTTETAKLAGKLAGDEIRANVVKLNIDSIRTNSDSLVKIAALKNDNLAIALRQRDQQLQEQQIEVARTDAKVKSASLALALEERNERLALKKEDAAAREDMLAAVNTGRKINGDLPPFRSYAEMQTAAKMNPKLQETISLQYQAGLTAQQTGVASIGSTPYEALKYVAASGAKITDGRSKVINFVDSVKNQIMQDPKIAPGLKKDADLAKALDSTVSSTVSSMQRNITSGTGNIYAPPPIQTFLQDPEFSKTYLAESILAPGAKLGTETINFKVAASQLIQASREGIIPMQQVDAELGFLAEKIKGYNNSLYRYKATAGIPDMTTVNVALDDTGYVGRALAAGYTSTALNPVATTATAVLSGLPNWLAGGSNETIVDLSNPTQRSAYINKQMAQSIPAVIREQALITNTSKIGK